MTVAPPQCQCNIQTDQPCPVHGIFKLQPGETAEERSIRIDIFPGLKKKEADEAEGLADPRQVLAAAWEAVEIQDVEASRIFVLYEGKDMSNPGGQAGWAYSGNPRLLAKRLRQLADKIDPGLQPDPLGHLCTCPGPGVTAVECPIHG